MNVYPISATKQTTPQPKIYGSRPNNDLLAAIILRAVKDANGKDHKTAYEAIIWLSNAGPEWVLYLGVKPEYYFPWLAGILEKGQ